METAPASLDAESAPTDASPSVPDHNYDEKRGWTYYYVAAVSDEDRKKGRAAGSVVAYQYLGKNEEGQHVLASMNTNGTVSHRASCASPCRIIDMSYGGNLAYSGRQSVGLGKDVSVRVEFGGRRINKKKKKQ